MTAHAHEHHQHDHHAEPAQGHDAHGAHGCHDKHAGHSPEMFRQRFWLTLALTIPVVLFSEMVQDWLGFSLPSFPGDSAIPPVLGTAVSGPAARS